MKIIDIEDIANVNELLSSTTYEVYCNFDECIYCHKPIESDYYEWNDDWYQPKRCNCKNAEDELKIKLEALNTLLKLEKFNKFVDREYIINQKIQYSESQIRRKYELED